MAARLVLVSGTSAVRGTGGASNAVLHPAMTSRSPEGPKLISSVVEQRWAFERSLGTAHPSSPAHSRPRSPRDNFDGVIIAIMIHNPAKRLMTQQINPMIGTNATKPMKHVKRTLLSRFVVEGP
ncbi:hypothetical protein ACTFTM_04280 [Micromonospora sp. RB23]